MSALTRRRFVAISACGTVVPCLAGATAKTPYTWQGTALGARASITLHNADPQQSDTAVAAVVSEISRLEGLFSLYRADSALSALNAGGSLAHPDPEFLTLLSTADAVYRATEGVFDPTVQGLWAELARLYSRGVPHRDEIVAARERARPGIGFDAVSADGGSVRLGREGMALTLNGIAQGYITDRVTELLRAAGLKNVLVNMGEVRAIGGRSDGTPWKVGIAEAGGTGRIVRTLQLRDRALATSQTLGTAFDDAGTVGHIIDPRNGVPASLKRQVSVEAPTAALADALSTAVCVMPEGAARAAVRQFDGCRIVHAA